MNYAENANQQLSKLYLEGSDYALEEIGRTFGLLECILEDNDSTREAQLAQECAAIGFCLLEDRKSVDIELLEEHVAGFIRGFACYKTLR